MGSRSAATPACCWAALFMRLARCPQGDSQGMLVKPLHLRSREAAMQGRRRQKRKDVAGRGRVGTATGPAGQCTRAASTTSAILRSVAAPASFWAAGGGLQAADPKTHEQKLSSLSTTPFPQPWGAQPSAARAPSSWKAKASTNSQAASPAEPPAAILSSALRRQGWHPRKSEVRASSRGGAQWR